MEDTVETPDAYKNVQNSDTIREKANCYYEQTSTRRRTTNCQVITRLTAN